MTKMTRDEFFMRLQKSKGIWMALASINELINEGYTPEDTNQILKYAVQEHANYVCAGKEHKLN